MTGPTQLLWPITTQSYGTSIDIMSQTNVTIELLIFLASVTIMVKTRDAVTIFQPHKSNLNLTLLIPTFTVLLPTFISFPSYVPTFLIVPHLTYILIFSAAIILDLRKILKKRTPRDSAKLIPEDFKKPKFQTKNPKKPKRPNRQGRKNRVSYSDSL